MHYTLHLTNNCNLGCTYCYVNQNNIKTMTKETARRAVDLAAKNSVGSTGIIFFGGEPLLCRETIYETIDYCKWVEKNSGAVFHYKITTNGLLLDKEFIEFSLRENLFIALSHDGVAEAHDKHRLDREGVGSFSRLSPKIDMLLSARPYSPVLMVINPDTARYFAESVIYLYNRGFRYIVCSLNYAAEWDEHDMDELERQYKSLADFYYKRTREEEKFYLSPFEVKISSHISGDSYCTERCELGKKQVSVGPDGRLYPCVQFVGDSGWSIGDVDTGINSERQEIIYALNEEEKESCRDCTIRKRCNHYCGCMNKQATGSIDRVSPVLCAHERMLMPIADKLAERLYRKKNAMFIQKHYNDMYPVLSLIEDRTGKP